MIHANCGVIAVIASTTYMTIVELFDEYLAPFSTSLVSRLPPPNGEDREPDNIGGVKPWTSGNVIICVTKEDTPLPEYSCDCLALL